MLDKVLVPHEKKTHVEKVKKKKHTHTHTKLHKSKWRKQARPFLEQNPGTAGLTVLEHQKPVLFKKYSAPNCHFLKISKKKRHWKVKRQSSSLNNLQPTFVWRGVFTPFFRKTQKKTSKLRGFYLPTSLKRIEAQVTALTKGAPCP